MHGVTAACDGHFRATDFHLMQRLPTDNKATKILQASENTLKERNTQQKASENTHLTTEASLKERKKQEQCSDNKEPTIKITAAAAVGDEG